MVGTMKGIEEQRALYVWAKPRKDAFLDQTELNPKRQRTGTDPIISTGRSGMSVTVVNVGYKDYVPLL
jgi:hypothetical protein